MLNFFAINVSYIISPASMDFLSDWIYMKDHVAHT